MVLVLVDRPGGTNLSIRSFTFQNSDTSAFAQAFSKALGGRELGKILSVSATTDTLVITMSKLGTSRLKYVVTHQADGRHTAKLQDESIALTHRAFRAEIERKLTRVLESCGASCVVD
jgi:hypothetical protein